MINADALLAAMERPTIVIGGVRHEGRLLSHLEYYQWRDRLDGWQAGTFPSGSAETEVRELFMALDLPADLILALPKPVVEEAIVDFFACQTRSGPGSPTADSTSAPERRPGDLSAPSSPTPAEASAT